MQCGRRSVSEMRKNPRVIGTTDLSISKAEEELGFQLPDAFREWLKQNNGRSIEDVNLFPVFDERDPGNTWDSIVRNFKTNWKEWIDRFGSNPKFSHLLPFGEFGSGDYFCFDFSKCSVNEEPVIVLWSHETGDSVIAASDFAEFVD